MDADSSFEFIRCSLPPPFQYFHDVKLSLLFDSYRLDCLTILLSYLLLFLLSYLSTSITSVPQKVSRGLRKQLEAVTSNMHSDSVRGSGSEKLTGRREHKPDGSTSSNLRDFDSNAEYDFNDQLNRRILQNNYLGNTSTYNPSGLERNRNSHIDNYSNSNEINNRGRNVRHDSSMSRQNSTMERGRDRDRGRSNGSNQSELVSNVGTYEESVQGEAVQSDIMELDQEIGIIGLCTFFCHFIPYDDMLSIY